MSEPWANALRLIVLCQTLVLAVFVLPGDSTGDPPQPLAGTEPLTREGDIASQLVAGADSFLRKKLSESVDERASHWKRDFSSAEKYNTSIEPNRAPRWTGCSSSAARPSRHG
jgi:hypothetical protein